MEPGAPPTLERLPLDKIYASPHQMRKHFDRNGLRDLARSLEQEGLIQPIAVRKVGNAYELVVGERRLRAAQMLGWKTIDARVIEVSDEDAAIKGLIENLQRADLNPLEEAKGYKQLVEPPYKMTQEAIADRVGKSQTCIARCLALLDLPLEIQALMPRGIITETHTRSLRKITDRTKQIQLAKRANREGWTVKETERRVKEALRQTGQPLSPRDMRLSLQADPLAQLWKPILEAVQDEGVKVSSVRYEGKNRWILRIETGSSPDTKNALANLFIRLGNTLNSPIPSDLLE